MPPKFIIVTGGVLSGVGKGTTAAALCRLLRDGTRIVPIKCDGYLNVDPGTMNPIEHGEVFVLADGGEVDMDFGHYERFLNITCKREWSITSGKIFDRIIKNERSGDYLGHTIQIFPHVTNEIKKWIAEIARREKPDIVLIEIGGTVGDVENSWFIEAVRELKRDVGPENIAYMHLTYVPYLNAVGEQKTKPAQRDVALLKEKGIVPDLLVCRSNENISPKIKEKLALFCDMDIAQVIAAPDAPSVYDIPLDLCREGSLDVICKKLNLPVRHDLASWQTLVQNIHHPRSTVTIGICGKYTALRDSYASVTEALTHAGAHLETGVTIKFIDTRSEHVSNALAGCDGIIVPGGFGSDGVDGKIEAIRIAREKRIPYLGICYGLQLAVVEFARNVCGLKDAQTTEINQMTANPIIDLMQHQKGLHNKGATMRLGEYPAVLRNGSIVAKLYGALEARERHRHRYEVNPEYHSILEQHGLVISGKSPDGRLAEFIELPDHPYFVATQAHNELTSRLEQPNPLFVGLVRAAIELHALCSATPL